MVKATKGKLITKVRHSQRWLTPPPGVLVECDPSIKAIIIQIDNDNDHAFILEDLEDKFLLVQESKLGELKLRLEDVSVLHELWNSH